MISSPTLLHCTRDGKLRFLKRCILPIAAPGVVKLVATDLGLFEVTSQQFLVRNKVRYLCT